MLTQYPKTYNLILIIALALCTLNCQNKFDSNKAPWNNYYSFNTSHQSTDQWDATSDNQPNISLVENLIQNNHIERAQQILNDIEEEHLNSEDKNKYYLFHSIVALGSKNTKIAKKFLHKVNHQSLSANNALLYYKVNKDMFYINKNHTNYVLNLIKSQEYLREKSHLAYNSHLILKTLAESNRSQLNKLKKYNSNGWLELAYQRSISPLQILQLADPKSITNWLKKHPSHLANKLDIVKSINTKPIPKKIALLIPLTGPLSNPGQKIQEGFMDAYFSFKNNLTSIPEIEIYDTSINDIEELYKTAITEGADLIIGPLEKTKLEQLISSSTKLTVPTLALNYINDQKKYNNLYQFGLDPQQEAQQIAIKAINNGNSRILIISPENNHGAKISNTFATVWKELGGEIIDHITYTNLSNIDSLIKKLLHIDRSQERSKKLSSILNADITFYPRRRHDFDSIFIVSSNKHAKQIKPRINYYYAKSIPTYSISSIHSAEPNIQKQFELDDIILCDIPWIFTNNSQHFNNIPWRDEFNSAQRLFALGRDAFKISISLNNFTQMPYLGFYGDTGYLTMENNRIYRSLTMAKFTNGIIKKLDP